MRFIEHLLGGSKKFRANFVKTASSNAISQAIGIVSLPILSRLFAPEAFGILTTYTLVQSIMLSFLTLRMEWIIPNSKMERRVKELIVLGLIVSALFLLILLFLFFLFKNYTVLMFDTQVGNLEITLLLFGVISGVFQLLGQAWYVFTGDLSRVAKAKLTQALVTLVLSLAFGMLMPVSTALIFAYVSGFALAACVLFSGKKAPKLKKPFTVFRKARLLLFFYRSQLLSSTALSIVNISMTMSITGLLILFYSAKIIGWYGLVFRVATAPIGLITAALVQSFWADSATMAKSDPKSLRHFYISTIKRLAILAIPMGALFLMGPFYIPYIFGPEEWSGAGLLLMAVTPYLVGMIVFSPTTHLIVYNKAHWQLLCDFGTFIFVIIAFISVAKLGHEAWVAVLAASSVILLGYVVRFFVHLKANHQQIEKT